MLTPERAISTCIISAPTTPAAATWSMQHRSCGRRILQHPGAKCRIACWTSLVARAARCPRQEKFFGGETSGKYRYSPASIAMGASIASSHASIWHTPCNLLKPGGAQRPVETTSSHFKVGPPAFFGCAVALPLTRMPGGGTLPPGLRPHFRFLTAGGPCFRGPRLGRPLTPARAVR